MRLKELFGRKQPRRSYRLSPGVKDYRMIIDAEERAFDRYLRMRETILDEVRELRGEDSFERTVENIRRLREVEAELGNGKDTHWWQALSQIAALLLAGQGSGRPLVGLPSSSTPVAVSTEAHSPSQPEPAPPPAPEVKGSATPSDAEVSLMAWQFVIADAVASEMDAEVVSEMIAARCQSDDVMRQIMAQLVRLEPEQIINYLQRFKPTLADDLHVRRRIEMIKQLLEGELAYE